MQNLLLASYNKGYYCPLTFKLTQNQRKGNRQSFSLSSNTALSLYKHRNVKRWNVLASSSSHEQELTSGKGGAMFYRKN